MYYLPYTIYYASILYFWGPNKITIYYASILYFWGPNKIGLWTAGQSMSCSRNKNGLWTAGQSMSCSRNKNGLWTAGQSMSCSRRRRVGQPIPRSLKYPNMGYVGFLSWESYPALGSTPKSKTKNYTNIPIYTYIHLHTERIEWIPDIAPLMSKCQSKRALRLVDRMP